jgi:hypothetical protein
VPETSATYAAFLTFAFVSSITPGSKNLMILVSGAALGWRRTLPHIVGAVLGGRGLDLIDISGGTYLPCAPSSSDRASGGPCFVEFTAAARSRTCVPLMATGGFKRRAEAEAAMKDGAVDLVGLARALVLDPALSSTWAENGPDPAFPRFAPPPPGGVTAWFTMRLTEIGEERGGEAAPDALVALKHYEAPDAARVPLWNERFYGDGHVTGGVT